MRVHEQAHASTGGQYAGAPQYEYTTGPDNKRYVTDGEVSIDVSEEKTPEETLKKMEQVRAAALAPAEPSSQDLKVAAEASQKATEARSEIAKGQTETASVGSTSVQSNGIVADTGAAVQPDTNIGTATDSIADMVLDNQSSSADTQGFQANESNVMQTRIGRIQNAYLQAYTPSREGLSLQA